MDVVLNFLFPGDKIKFDIEDNLSKEFNLPKRIECVVNSVGYHHPNYCLEYLITLSIEDNISSNVIFSHLYIDTQIGQIRSSFTKYSDCDRIKPKTKHQIIDKLSIEVIRGVDNYAINNDYCKSICSIGILGVCSKNDKSCEFCYDSYGSDLSRFLLGDVIEYSNDSNTSLKEGIVFKLNSQDPEDVQLLVIDREDKRKLIRNYKKEKNRVRLLRRGSLAVTNNPCKLCMLSSCNNCELKPLKDLNIIHK